MPCIHTVAYYCVYSSCGILNRVYREGLFANVTFEVLLRSMCPHVNAQVELKRESYVAHIAFE